MEPQRSRFAGRAAGARSFIARSVCAALAPIGGAALAALVSCGILRTTAADVALASDLIDEINAADMMAGDDPPPPPPPLPGD